MKIYNRHNFFKHTYSIFHEINPEVIENLQPDYISKSKSSYYFTTEGVYRKSNHWGRAANCRWKLISDSYKSQNIIVAFAKWTDFYPNNETEKIYFIRINENNTISFHHKFEDKYLNTDILRTALDTAKRIKLINEVLNTENWCKYIKYSNYEDLKFHILDQLLNTNKSFNDIKKEMNGKA